MGNTCKQCKYAYDTSDEGCANCNGVTINIKGHDFDACECCQGYVPKEEVIDAKFEEVKQESTRLANEIFDNNVEQSNLNDKLTHNQEKAKVNKIYVKSGISFERDNTWYKFEYAEELDVSKCDNVEEVAEKLWDKCNSIVDKQARMV